MALVVHEAAETSRSLPVRICGLMPAMIVASTSSPLAPGCESNRRGQPASRNFDNSSRRP